MIESVTVRYGKKQRIIIAYDSGEDLTITETSVIEAARVEAAEHFDRNVDLAAIVKKQIKDEVVAMLKSVVDLDEDDPDRIRTMKVAAELEDPTDVKVSKLIAAERNRQISTRSEMIGRNTFGDLIAKTFHGDDLRKAAEKQTR